MFNVDAITKLNHELTLYQGSATVSHERLTLPTPALYCILYTVRFTILIFEPFKTLINKVSILTKPLGFILPVVLVFKSEGWVVKRGREVCEQQAEDNKRDCYENNHTVLRSEF